MQKKGNPNKFIEEDILNEIKHYLPAQSPLKDFIHHNTLHAFQDLKFEDALFKGAEIFGYKVFLNLQEFRNLYINKKINNDILENIIKNRKGIDNLNDCYKLIFNNYLSFIDNLFFFSRFSR